MNAVNLSEVASSAQEFENNIADVGSGCIDFRRTA